MHNPSPEARAIIPISRSSKKDEKKIELTRNILKILLNGLKPENFLPLKSELNKLLPDPLIFYPDSQSQNPIEISTSYLGLIQLHPSKIETTLTNGEETLVKQSVRITCIPDPQQQIPNFEIPPVPIIRPIRDGEDSWNIIKALLISYIKTLKGLQMPLEIEVDQLTINGLPSSATLSVTWSALKDIITQDSPNSKRCDFSNDLNSPRINLPFPCTLNEKNENQQFSPQNLGEFTRFVEMLLRKRFIADLNEVFNEIKKIVGEYLRIANLPKDQLPQFTSELYLTYLRWISQLMEVYLNEVISPLNNFLARRNSFEILW